MFRFACLVLLLSLAHDHVCAVDQPAATVTAPSTVDPVTTAPLPTKAPTTKAPTEAPTTNAPTEAPTTNAPTEAPTTNAPTEAPTTNAPTEAPTTNAPTEAPTTKATTEAPTTKATTLAPTTLPPATNATTLAPTTLPPATNATTLAPTTVPSTNATTLAPTTVPSTNATTLPPATNATTPAPVPPTTPTPPLPTPATGKYSIMTSPVNGTVCLMANFGLRIGFKQGGKFQDINLEPNGTAATGDCGANNSMLLLKSDKITVAFSFSNEAKKFHLHGLNVTIQLGAGETFTAVNTSLALWQAAVGSSYMCSKEQDYNITDTLSLHTYELRVQPFEVKKGDFSTAHECSMDDISILIPIIVGAALAGLILIVVIAYVIGRRKTYVGYQTL